MCFPFAQSALPSEIHPFLSEGFPLCDINLCVQKLLGSGVACWKSLTGVRGRGAFLLSVGNMALLRSLTGQGPWSAEPPRVRSATSQGSKQRLPCVWRKGLEVFDLCGSLPPLPSSPHVVPLETVSTAESQGQAAAPEKGRGTLERSRCRGRACC